MRPRLLVFLIIALPFFSSNSNASKKDKDKYPDIIAKLVTNLPIKFIKRKMVFNDYNSGDRKTIVADLQSFFNSNLSDITLLTKFKKFLVSITDGWPMLDSLESPVYALLLGYLSSEEIHQLNQNIGPFKCCQKTFQYYTEYEEHTTSGTCEEEPLIKNFEKMCKKSKTSQLLASTPDIEEKSSSTSSLAITIPPRTKSFPKFGQIPPPGKITRCVSDSLSSSPPKKPSPTSPIIKCRS